MAGHSKWANIKHRKAAQDKKRGRNFAKLIRAIESSAREAGSSDPSGSPSLALAVQKARDADVLKDNIERACRRGAGEDDGGARYEAATYEGYAPGGVALLIEVLTDNRNRTGAEIRNVFTKMGGSMAEPGSVSWQFHRRGIVLVDGSATEDDLLEVVLECGADDLADEGGAWRIACEPSAVASVRDTLEERGFGVIAADSPMVSDNLVPIDSVEAARSVVRIIEAMEDNDDVQDVYSNFEMSDEVLEAATS